MSYSPPATFVHGQYLTAAEMNTLSAALTAIHAISGDAAIVYAVPLVSSSIFTMVHKNRYLWFRSTGLLVDPAGIQDSISLSDPDRPTRYDLDTVGFLVYGDIYTITGVSWAVESET